LPIANRHDKAVLIQGFEFTFELFWKTPRPAHTPAPHTGSAGRAPRERALGHHERRRARQRHDVLRSIAAGTESRLELAQHLLRQLGMASEQREQPLARKYEELGGLGGHGQGGSVVGV
jgi:hypothetical protein